MASVTFKRGTKAEIESTQIQDGQLLMETDQLNNNKIYLDLPNGTRVPVGGSGAWVGTKEEFELAVEEGKIADGTQVIITDDYESGITASMTLYSNAQSGLVATNVQSAIDELDRNFRVDYLHSEYVSNKTVVATKTGFYLVCCNAFSKNSSGAYLNIKIDGSPYMSAYNSNQIATLSLSTALFLRDGQTVTKEVINCEDRIDAYNLFQVTYIGKN